MGPVVLSFPQKDFSEGITPQATNNEKTKGLIFNKKFRHIETALELDEKVYLFSNASRLGDSWVLRDGRMPLIISDKGVAAAEKSFSRKITEFKFLAMLCAAGGVAGLFMRFV